MAFEVARALHAPLDVLVVRKLGVPGQEELAMGAISSGGVRVLNTSILQGLDITMEQIESVVARELQELTRREQLYRNERPAPNVRMQTVILVDDGIATGSTMLAALACLKKQQPAHIIVAVPVAPPSTVRELRAEGTEVVCVKTEEPFLAIGAWYEDFAQLSDEEVCGLMERAAREQLGTSHL